MAEIKHTELLEAGHTVIYLILCISNQIQIFLKCLGMRIV